MSRVFVDHMFITESSHHLISRKEFGQLCMYHLHVSTCPQRFMVFLIEFPIESPLVLDCTPKMSDRCYSELWCGGVVAQMQSIQQTGFLGIRQGVKKNPHLRCCWTDLSFRCLISAESRTWKSLWQCALLLKAQAAKDVFFTLQSFQVFTVI